LSISTSTRPLSHSERGVRGAQKRWSQPANRQTVHLDQLTSDERRLVLALLDAAHARREAEGVEEIG
jgi:hypothetical protein